MSSSDNRPESAAQDQSLEDSSAERTVDEESPKSAENFVECANCGRTFSGTYCPDCGQEVGRSPSVVDIAGQTFREVSDIEGGLRTTVVGLTLRPGQVLQEYLQGARRKYMSPGQYLTVAVLLFLGVVQGCTWLGLRGGFANAIAAEDATGLRELMEAISQVTQSQWFALAIVFLSAAILASIFWRLFHEQLSQGAEALAIGVFLMAHASILSAGLKLVFIPAMYFGTGHPVDPTVSSGIGSVIMVLYPGIAAHRGFGTGWMNALKSVLGAFWAYVETIGLGSTLMIWYFVWSFPAFPEDIANESPNAILFGLGIVSVVYLTPALIHAGVEVYHRLR